MPSDAMRGRLGSFPATLLTSTQNLHFGPTSLRGGYSAYVEYAEVSEGVFRGARPCPLPNTQSGIGVRRLLCRPSLISCGAYPGASEGCCQVRVP